MCFQLHSSAEYILTNNETEYILMDDETETFLNDIVSKIKNAMKYDPEITVYISSSTVLNASASQRGDMMINAGAIMQCKNVGELIGIIAHEVGHISGQHITTFLASSGDFMRAGLVTMLIGAVAAALAQDITPFAAGAMSGQHIAQGMALGKLRQKEGMADTKAAEAVKILQWPVLKDFISIHEKLGSGSPAFNVYESTHPTPLDRISKFRRLCEEEKNTTYPKEKIDLLNKMQKKFEIIKEKIKALIYSPEMIINNISNPSNISGKYAKAVALYRANHYRESIKLIDELMKLPDNEAIDFTYYAEIKSMCLIGEKKYKEAAELAFSFLDKAKKTKIYRDLGIIYADAIIKGDLGKTHSDRAIKILKKTLLKFKNDISVLYILGNLYSTQGRDDLASLCTAEVASAYGDIKTADIHAKKAAKSKDKIVKKKALDIISFKSFSPN